MADGETILRGVGGVRVKRAQRALLGPKVLSALGAGPLWEAPPRLLIMRYGYAQGTQPGETPNSSYKIIKNATNHEGPGL